MLKNVYPKSGVKTSDSESLDALESVLDCSLLREGRREPERLSPLLGRLTRQGVLALRGSKRGAYYERGAKDMAKSKMILARSKRAQSPAKPHKRSGREA
jgi:hypothetical protein